MEPETTVSGPIPIFTWLVVDCLPEIGRYFYMGDDLLHVNENTPPTELLLLGAELFEAGPNAVLPGLKAQVEKLLGKDEFQFMFREIGQYQLSFTWVIRLKDQAEKIKLIHEWLKYEELEEIVTVYEKPIDEDGYKILLRGIHY